MKKIWMVAVVLAVAALSSSANAQSFSYRGPEGGKVTVGPYGVRITAPRVNYPPNYYHNNYRSPGLSVTIAGGGIAARHPNTGLANQFRNTGLVYRIPFQGIARRR